MAKAYIESKNTQLMLMIRGRYTNELNHLI